MSLATCIGLFDTGAESVAGCSASEPPLACVPDSFNSNACQAPAADNREAAFVSKLLHSCSHSAFLKAFFLNVLGCFVVALLIYRLALI